MWATEARIANGTHHGGVELVESADVDSGEIVIQAVTGTKPARARLELVRDPVQAAAAAQTVSEFAARKLTLDTRPRQKISIDGEIAAKTPVTVSACRTRCDRGAAGQIGGTR